MSAAIFWVTFSYLPTRTRRKKLRPVLELDMYLISTNLFFLFDLIMKPTKHRTSGFQSTIKGGLLTQNDIKLGLQNKCLNKSYLYDEHINDYLIVIGEQIFKLSKETDRLIDKIFNLSQYATAEELLLLEQIRQELRKYDYDEKKINQDAAMLFNDGISYPSVSIIYYREQNFMNFTLPCKILY